MVPLFATWCLAFVTAGGDEAGPRPSRASHWQLGLGHFVDCGLTSQAVENRYGPNALGMGWDRTHDPDRPGVWCMRCDADGASGFDGFHGMEQVTEDFRDAGFINDAPDEVVVMFEIRVSGDGFDDDGDRAGAGYGEFFVLRSLLGNDTEHAVRLRHARSGDTTRGQVQARINGVVVAHDWIGGDRLAVERWSTVLIRYRTSSDPGNRPDGRVDVWVADRAMDDVIPEIDFRQVVHAVPHDTGPAKRYRFGASSSAPGFAPVAHHFARICRGPWVDDLPTTFRAVRYKHYGVEAGVDLPTEVVGRRDVSVTYRHDAGLLGAPATVRFEHDTDPAFGAPVGTVAIPLSESNDWHGTATLTGLAADTTHWVRATVTIGGGRTIVTEPCRFRTLTDDAPGRVRFAFASCSQHSPDRQPNRTFETVAALEPDLNFFVHLGDQAYVDTRLKQRFGHEWPALTGVQDFEDVHTLLMTGHSQLLGATATPIWRQWDDHEVVDSWYGEVVDATLYAKARQAFRTYTPHARPGAGTVYLGPVPGGGDLATAPDAGDGLSPSGGFWTHQDVNFWYTESAHVLFVMLDTRTVRSQTLRTMLGDTQLRWLLDLIEVTRKRVVCLFSPVRWTDGHVGKPNDYWGTAETFEGLFVEERGRIIDHFLETHGDERFLLLLSGDDHLSSASRWFGLGGHDNVYEVLCGALCVRNISPRMLPSWISAPDDRFDWLTNNGLARTQTARMYVVVEIDESSGEIRLVLEDGNTGDAIASTTVGVDAPNP